MIISQKSVKQIKVKWLRFGFRWCWERIRKPVVAGKEQNRFFFFLPALHLGVDPARRFGFGDLCRRESWNLNSFMPQFVTDRSFQAILKCKISFVCFGPCWATVRSNILAHMEEDLNHCLRDHVGMWWRKTRLSCIHETVLVQIKHLWLEWLSLETTALSRGRTVTVMCPQHHHRHGLVTQSVTQCLMSVRRTKILRIVCLKV